MTRLVVPSGLAEAQRVLCLRDRCGFCRLYPGYGVVCVERGCKVSSQSRPCNSYSEMSPGEYLEYMGMRAELAKKRKREYNQRYLRKHPERNRESQRRYYWANREEILAHKRAYRRRQKMLALSTPDEVEVTIQ